MRRLLNFRIILIFTIITNNLYSQNSFVDSLLIPKENNIFLLIIQEKLIFKSDTN